MKSSLHPAFSILPRIDPVAGSASAGLRAMQRMQCKVFRAVASAIAGLILVHGDIQNPMQAVLNAPVTAAASDKTLWYQRLAVPEIAGLADLPATGLARRSHLANGAQAGPVMALQQPASAR